jgi:RNA polymerase sigma-70 factor (ECF subfamily)
MNESEQSRIFEQWLKEYSPLLFKVARSFAFTLGDQDDLFQEVSIQVWRSVPKFKEQSAVSTWLYRIALNTAITWSRKEKKHQDGRQNIDVMNNILQENVKHVDERLTWLYQEIGKLNKIDRSLALLILDGFNYKEMAEILGVSETNLGVKVHRIKKHLIEKSKTYNHGI